MQTGILFRCEKIIISCCSSKHLHLEYNPKQTKKHTKVNSKIKEYKVLLHNPTVRPGSGTDKGHANRSANISLGDSSGIETSSHVSRSVMRESNLADMLLQTTSPKSK